MFSSNHSSSQVKNEFPAMDLENQSVRVTRTVDVSTEPRNSLDEFSKVQGIEIADHNTFEPVPWTRRRMGSNVGCEGDVLPGIAPEDFSIFKDRSRASSDAQLVRAETDTDLSRRRSMLEQMDPMVTRLKSMRRSAG
jgi:hypothetical protein